MLNTENEIRSYTTNCINCLDFYYILRPCDSPNKDYQIVITRLSTDEEEKLNNNEPVILKRKDTTFIVQPDLCYAYGELDLSPNSKDINTIYNSKYFSYLDIHISCLSKYDYNSHTVTSDVRGGRYFWSNNPKDYLPYIHGCIGKPSKVVIFKEYIVVHKKKRSVSKTTGSSNNTTYKKELNRAKTIAKRQAKISNYKFTIKKSL